MSQKNIVFYVNELWRHPPDGEGHLVRLPAVVVLLKRGGKGMREQALSCVCVCVCVRVCVCGACYHCACETTDLKDLFAQAIISNLHNMVTSDQTVATGQVTGGRQEL